jgi:hypothetical protein
VLFDHHESEGPIVEGAREDDPHHSWPEALGSGAKERIDARPVAILTRTASHLNSVSLDEQVLIRPGYVDPSRNNLLAIGWMTGVQRPGPPEDMRKGADAFGGEVMNDKDCCWEVARELGYKPGQSFDSASGKADHNNIMSWHRDLLLPRY